MDDPYNLQRFIDAQDGVYEQVRAELHGGQKRGHWMWFIFPQIKGLGQSALATKFAISSRAEAKAYLNHPVLGSRLRECTRLVLKSPMHSIEQIFAYPDDLKFHSSMTLFAEAAADKQDFIDAIERFYAGKFDRLTIEQLARIEG
jgi:uncharacterized protein (DUF1810 family)